MPANNTTEATATRKGTLKNDCRELLHRSPSQKHC
ncbi:unnamed protein product [Haemonchus placei]|uniref:Uncharacterized protein n=1 Tax=Haemonchus placei TaxID=6290 RepID=A0A3P7W6C1_HAEPC|nr:unnamed protein product [Haemonchus placei]